MVWETLFSHVTIHVARSGSLVPSHRKLCLLPSKVSWMMGVPEENTKMMFFRTDQTLWQLNLAQ